MMRTTSAPEAVSRLPVGSSASSSFGCMTIARAMATRWRSPPESCAGRWSTRSTRPTPSSARRARSWRSAIGVPASSIGSSTFSREVMRGTRWKDWNTKPIWLLARGGELVVGHGRGVHAVEPVGARCRRVEQPEHVEQRGLARARRPHDGKVLAGLDAEAHVVQRPHQLVAHLEGTRQRLEPDHRGAMPRLLPDRGNAVGHAFAVHRQHHQVALGEALRRSR